MARHGRAPATLQTRPRILPDFASSHIPPRAVARASRRRARLAELSWPMPTAAGYTAADRGAIPAPDRSERLRRERTSGPHKTSNRRYRVTPPRFREGSCRLCLSPRQRKSRREREATPRRRRAPSAAPMVRILFPPVASQLQTWIARSGHRNLVRVARPPQTTFVGEANDVSSKMSLTWCQAAWSFHALFRSG